MVLVSLLLAACATVATAGEPGDHPGLSPQAQAKHDSFAPKARVAFGKFELHYFGARGKAETVRLLLNDQKLDYEEVRYARPIDGHLGPNLKDWTVEKAKGIASGLMPFGQMPSLRHTVGTGGVVNGASNTPKQEIIPQSRAIMNYIGRITGLYGKDPEVDMKVDVMIGGIEDVKGKWRAHFYGKEKTAADIAAALPKYLEEIPVWLGFLETLKAKNAGPFMVGYSLSLADFYAFEACDQALRADPTLLDGFPGLKAFVGKFASRPNVKSYLEGTHGGALRVPFTGGPDTAEAPGAGAAYLRGLLVETGKEL